MSTTQILSMGNGNRDFSLQMVGKTIKDIFAEEWPFNNTRNIEIKPSFQVKFVRLSANDVIACSYMQIVQDYDKCVISYDNFCNNLIISTESTAAIISLTSPTIHPTLIDEISKLNKAEVIFYDFDFSTQEFLRNNGIYIKGFTIKQNSKPEKVFQERLKTFSDHQIYQYIANYRQFQKDTAAKKQPVPTKTISLITSAFYPVVLLKLMPEPNLIPRTVNEILSNYNVTQSLLDTIKVPFSKEKCHECPICHSYKWGNFSAFTQHVITKHHIEAYSNLFEGRSKQDFVCDICKAHKTEASFNDHVFAHNEHMALVLGAIHGPSTVLGKYIRSLIKLPDPIGIVNSEPPSPDMFAIPTQPIQNQPEQTTADAAKSELPPGFAPSKIEKTENPPGFAPAKDERPSPGFNPKIITSTKTEDPKPPGFAPKRPEVVGFNPMAIQQKPPAFNPAAIQQKPPMFNPAAIQTKPPAFSPMAIQEKPAPAHAPTQPLPQTQTVAENPGKRTFSPATVQQKPPSFSPATVQRPSPPQYVPAAIATRAGSKTSPVIAKSSSAELANKIITKKKTGDYVDDNFWKDLERMERSMKARGMLQLDGLKFKCSVCKRKCGSAIDLLQHCWSQHRDQ